MGRVSIYTPTWRKINEYLMELESAADRTTLLDIAIHRIEDLIPFDCGAGILDSSLRVTVGFGVPESTICVYNEYYRLKMPTILYGPHGEWEFGPGQSRWPEFPLGPGQSRWRDFPNSEFYVDFAKPNGIGYDLSPVSPSGPSSLVIQRSFAGKDFCARDREIIEITNPHVNNLLSAREKLDKLVKEKRAPREDIRSCFPFLSKREAQVAAHLCDGLSAKEIASSLLIGVRTVETYIAHLYFKLDVLCKADAIRLIRSRLVR
jgi:DNA-binding CsgD family transcriptional regulator